MFTMDSEYMKRLEKFINDPATAPKERDMPRGLEGNIAVEDIRKLNQYLLYIVIDRSLSMRFNGLEEAVRKGLEDVKYVVATSDENRFGQLQIAITLFGSTLDMRPFQFWEDVDISYDANEISTYLYDAVIESCQNMVAQYDILREICEVRGTMLIFTDGGENGSQHTLQDLQKALKDMIRSDSIGLKRNIKYLVAAFKDVDLKQLGIDFDTEPIYIGDGHRLRRLLRFVGRSVIID